MIDLLYILALEFVLKGLEADCWIALPLMLHPTVDQLWIVLQVEQGGGRFCERLPLFQKAICVWFEFD